MKTNHKLMTTLMLLNTPFAIASGQPLEAINVEETHSDLAKTNIETQALSNTGNTETGSLLRQINGVEASRMGGHGLDPIIRGQSQSQLNIILDGATIHAGCPNRMDPPTSYAEISSFDEVTVIKGVPSVKNSAGGSGGGLLFKRDKPVYNPEKSVSGKVSALKSNVMNYDANAKMTAVAEQGYLAIQASKKEGNNYLDGDGNTVGASFDTTQGHIDLGWTPSENHHLKVSHEISNTSDAVYPGARMDSPKSDGTISRIQYEGENLGNQKGAVSFSIYQSKVDHIMNNFSLRNPPVMMGNSIKRETLADTKTTGGKLEFSHRIAQSDISYGLQTENAQLDATLYNRNNNKSLFLMWPEVTTQTNSIFIEADTTFNKLVLTTGLRYDSVEAEAAKANVASDMNKKASSLYNNVYSDYNNDNKASEGNLNGVFRATYNLENASNTSFFAGFSRTNRTASATERYMAKGGMMRGKQNFWVGNPNIKPEQHNQFDIGLSQKNNNFGWDVSAWLDNVNDYILRDLATNQYGNGINASAKDKSEVYVNVNAQLLGLESSFNWKLADNIKLMGQVSYTEGRNTTDDRNLASISPLNGNLVTEYYTDSIIVGARINFALEQSNIDKYYTPISQYGKTDAWNTLDFYTETEISKNWQLKVGVDNVFDSSYYRAVNRGSLGETYKVNEPGRNLWLQVSAEL
jgi:iron complex outermembrane receptor protein